MNFKRTILLVEDEAEPADMLSNYLEMHGYEVLLAMEGNRALKLIDEHAQSIDLAILDIMVPEKDGYEICQYLRSHPVLSDVPVIFLTAKDKEKDEIAGLDLGADDYIPKPASLNLVKAHVESMLRRRPREKGNWLAYRNVYITSDSMEAWQNGEKIELTTTEFKLLKLFFENPKRVYTRQEILEYITDEEKYVFDRTVDVHIKNLRLKLRDDGELIKTYRGMGYGLNKELALT
ncbi:response regulator transcription factor [Natronogracilivirga saccharolytica]|uniref:Response regulator transcription factor n=1 Tax=Natronogracilivirga saccharolytica TaxID=2812953 RepID=A0A8J7SCC2_9BACT|nr:response regulator transcription factor [Natronogracilivirga saccharolytica]MBP3193436.1 response regulator transcription factor [Natronogracilivirga saccharolytica]